MSQAYEFSHSNFNRTTRYIHFDEQKSVYGPLEHVGRGGGVASAPVAPPLPMGLAFVNAFFTI